MEMIITDTLIPSENIPTTSGLGVILIVTELAFKLILKSCLYMILCSHFPQ